MAQRAVIEGTGRELAEILQERPDERYRLIPLAGPAQRPLHESATPEEWIAELRAWASEHDTNTESLSDEAVGRDAIYEGRA